ncbi:MAG: SpoIIE family protein phosphatase [Phycisphaerae bacterium]|nr:SpoIIE family protein phosphatase [Phycisphaerae bacterium]
MTGADGANDPADMPSRPPRFWNTLAFRIAMLINTTAILVLGSAEFIDFRHERRALLSQEYEKLKEEADVLGVARSRFGNPDDFQPFLDDFCTQMSSAASPGHHILVLDPSGTVPLRAHARADPDLEGEMIAAVRGPNPSAEFKHRNAVYLVATAATRGGRSIVVAQSLDPMLRLLRSRAIGRLFGVGALTLLIFVATGVGLWFWIRRPLRQLVAVVDEVGRGRFQTRADGVGSAEVQFLARGINAMAQSLGRVENTRRAEMERARKIQQRLLPPRETRLHGLSLFSAFLPTTSVAGDLFDCVELPDGSVVLAVIDVAGHGVPAALYTALLRTVLRYEINGTSGLDDLLSRTNRQLQAVSDAGDFATCFVVRVEPDHQNIQFSKAGHDAAILLHLDGSVDLLETEGLPLGISPGEGYQSGSVPFRPQDRLILYTDGLHELFDAGGVPFGRERLLQLVQTTRQLSPEEQVSHIIAKAQEFQGSSAFGDDVTLVILQRD